MTKNKFFKSLSLYRFHLILVLVAVLCVIFGYSQITEPPLPSNFKDKIISIEEIKDSPDPSLDRLMSHVYNIAKEPHPSDSEAVKDVRKYLTSQIEKMGLKYEIQSFERDILGEWLNSHYEQISNNPELGAFREKWAKENGYNSFEDYYREYIVGNTEYQNILVKIGPENPKYKFLMMAHYDSVKQGPGAGDDAVSVAALLECMRILSQKDDMKNAVYFLITDGEESNLVGSEYFIKNPLFYPEEITMITNFDARGNKSVPFIYQSSANNKNLIKIAANVLRKKWMLSWAADIFKIMPNSSDLKNFINAGYSGLDFAMGGGFEHYHQPSDNYENLSRRSANQYLNMTTDFANYFSTVQNIETESNEDAVAFTFLNGQVLVFSSFGMKVFGIAISILTILFLVFYFIKNSSKLKGFAICLGIILLDFALAVPLYFFEDNITKFAPWLTTEFWDLVYVSMTSLVITLALMFIAKNFFKIHNSSLKMITLFIFAVLSAVTSILFNSASYVFSIPLLFILISSIFEMLNSSRIQNFILKSIVILVFCMIFVPTIVIAQMAVPSYIFAFFILSTIGALPILSEVLNA